MSLGKSQKKFLVILCIISISSLAFINDKAYAASCTGCSGQGCTCCDTCRDACCGKWPACANPWGVEIQGQICCEDWSTMTDCDWRCCGGCFTGETEVVSELASDQTIENLEVGDIVSSFDPETGEVSEGEVSEVNKLTREGYFELETESGKKVKATAEHPFLAVGNESFIAKLKEVFSHTLTHQLITGFQTKIAEVMK